MHAEEAGGCGGAAIPDEMTMGRSGGLDAGPIKKYLSKAVVVCRARRDDLQVV